MTTKAGIKKHGDRAKEVLFIEFLQLHDMNVFIPIDKRDLIREQIKGTLWALSMIKEKRDYSLKGRTYAASTL